MPVIIIDPGVSFAIAKFSINDILCDSEHKFCIQFESAFRDLTSIILFFVRRRLLLLQTQTALKPLNIHLISFPLLLLLLLNLFPLEIIITQLASKRLQLLPKVRRDLNRVLNRSSIILRIPINRHLLEV